MKAVAGTIKILLLDDQYVDNNPVPPCKDIHDEFIDAFGIQPDKHDIWSASDDVRLDRYTWESPAVELYLYRSIWGSNDLLLHHFDILLLDVDFAHDPLVEKLSGYTRQSNLGGILLGICYQARISSICQVFTAQDSKLRRDNVDYWYLDRATEVDPSCLGSLKIEVLPGDKNLRDIVQKSFSRWCAEILPRLDPNRSELAGMVSWLRAPNGVNKGNGDEGNGDRSLTFIHGGNRDVATRHALPWNTFKTLLPQELDKVLVSLNRTICGHQLVRRTFCTLAGHFGTLSADGMLGILNNRNQCKEFKEFHESLETACDLFDVSYADFLVKLVADVDNKCKSLTRVDLCDALVGRADPATVLFGIFECLNTWKNTLKLEIQALLCGNALACNLSVIGVNVDKYGKAIDATIRPPRTSWGRKISISGDRKDANYLSCNGGSWNALVDTLKLGVIASDLHLSGCSGRVDMRTGVVICDKTMDTVTLEITVYHTPDVE